MPIGNPNHPVVQQAEDQWYKLCAILMQKFGVTEVEVTAADVAAFSTSGYASIALDCRGRHLILRLVDAQTAAQLVREAGGQAH